MSSDDRAASRIARTAAATLLAVAMLHCSTGTPTAPNGPLTVNSPPQARYLGIDACIGCHKDKAATFAHTGMGRSAFPMSRQVASEDFTRRNEIEIAREGSLRYRMVERAGKYFMRQFVLDASGAESSVDERPMEWVIGSGNHSRSYVTRVGSKLFQMPVCWYPEAALWDLCPGYEEKNDHFTREITEGCVFCHNARMELVAGTRNQYHEPIPSGIDCERCHGPGEAHVERWRNGKYEPTGGPDPTIVNPERLPAALRIQVCFQCHLGDSKATERVTRPGRDLTDWRPGLPIAEVMVPFWMKAPSRHDFGISSQADRLLRSRCVTQSSGRLECLSCHDPHVTVYERPAKFFRDVCLQCHQVADCKASEAARRATPKLPDDCVACHLRRAEPDDHRHTTFTDHWIRVPDVTVREAEARSAELEPILPEALGSLSAGERSYLEARAYFLKSLDFPEPVRKAMWRTAEEAFRASIAAGVRPADSWFFLGKILGYERRGEEATKALRNAVVLDPANRDAALAFGAALLSQMRVEEATEIFGQALERWPEDPGALAELARCKIATGATGEAIALLDRAIAAEPWTASLQLNRAVMLSASGRRDEAIAACREAARLDPVDRRIRQTCAEL